MSRPVESKALGPCLCLYLSAASITNIERQFGRCPLCDGTGACSQRVAEKFGEAWFALHPEEIEVQP